jgi:hypothetical protein
MSDGNAFVVAFDHDLIQIVLRARDPRAAEPHDAQAAAALRILSKAKALIVPTVLQELRDAGVPMDVLDRDRRFSIVPADDYFHGCAKGRAERYVEVYPDPRDCRAVAEAECAHAVVFVTLNERLIAGLAARTESIVVATPDQVLQRYLET